MECSFSSNEKVTDQSTLPSGQMEGIASGSTDNGVQGSNVEDSFQSFGNVAEQMNFDSYAGWCSSPSNMADHEMFSSFALSPTTMASTNFSSFDGLSFTHQYGNSIVDGDVMGNSFINRDKVIYHHMDSQLPFATSCADDGFDSIEMRDKSLDVIPRPLMQSLAEKMLRALDLFKEWSGGGILAQVWVPVQDGDRYILSTCEQPYLLDQTLSGYREVSRSFTFAAETKPGCFTGLPGRVFTSKIPEWTSNVMYYNKQEYLRVQHAVDHEVRGSIALPVFEDDSLGRSCCAVLELVTMKEKSNFDFEMENVCRALETVNLTSAASPRLYTQSLSKNQKSALAEITDVLRAICFAHQLPLALTWIPCSYIEGAGNVNLKLHARRCHNTINEKCILCLEVSASYVNDKDMEGFVHACVNHYLEEGQGIVGKALQSNHPFFYHDVKEYHISEYPLVHHARKFGLNAAVAIRLRSLYTGDDDYILEFFLPVNMRGSTEQQLLLNNLSSTMQKICKSLRTVSDDELRGLEDSKVKFQNAQMRRVPEISLSWRSSEQSLVGGNLNVVDNINQNLSESTSTRGEVDVPLQQIKPTTESRKQTEKKRNTSEKNVSLSALQPYFSGSLKDAAKSIGVCPTTLKRICRQHGISRWPSRKINKVNRSLKKIQSVLESVQGVEGGLGLDPTIRGLMPSGSIIQELDSRNRVVLPNANENHLSRDTDLVNQNSKSSTTSCMEIETTTVKTEGGCLLDGNKVPGQRNLSPLHMQRQEEPKIASLDDELSGSFFSRNRPSTTAVVDRDDVVVEHNQPTSSSMTNSSIGCESGSGSGSMMNDSSSSSKSFGKRQNHKSDQSCGDSGSKLIVKATYKEDTIRFKFEPASGCLELYEQVAKRFKLHKGQFQLKYLDDEEEWVMLVNDSDLQECLEILEFMGTRNVKFLVRDVPSTMGSSGGSNYFLGEGS
ncbi:hypothetical protein CASFOL_021412 [Castilleja foliolosa]|uniref:Uncharacterized protein n=1 Tax=Castilleja foliolosa TaxID=1961234 RepID=A0ABD3CWH5_9LAMI